VAGGKGEVLEILVRSPQLLIRWSKYSSMAFCRATRNARSASDTSPNEQGNSQHCTLDGTPQWIELIPTRTPGSAPQRYNGQPVYDPATNMNFEVNNPIHSSCLYRC
jgi:hypothetical protein